MSAELIPSVLIGFILLLGLANGFRRGVIKEGTALIGVLLGALLVEFWVERWAQPFADLIGMRLQNAQFTLSLALLIGTAIFSGYGSGLLIRRSKPRGGERWGGALLGLLNFALLVSFSLRYMQQYVYGETSPALPSQSWIRNSVVSRIMLDWIGWVLLGAAIAFGVLAVITATIRLSRALRQSSAPTAPAPKPVSGAGSATTKPTPASPATAKPPEAASQAPRTPAGQQESFLEKPRSQS